MMPGDTRQNLEDFLTAAGAQRMQLVVDGAEPITTHRVTALSTAIVFDAAGKEIFRGVDATTASLVAAVREATDQATQGTAG